MKGFATAWGRAFLGGLPPWPAPRRGPQASISTSRSSRSPPRRPQACWRSRLILAWVAPGCRIPFQMALARAETPSRAQLLRSPLCRTGVRGHPRPGSPKPHEGQPPKAVKGLVLPLHPPSWRCWGARTSAVGADPVHHPPLEVRAVIAGIAVGEADGPGFIPRIDRLAFFPAPAHPVDVEAGGVHVQRGRPFGPPGQSSGRPP